MGKLKDPDLALQDTRQVLSSLEADTWVIPQSGGKDSRAAAQAPLVLVERGLIKAPKRVIFYMADTMMEFWTFLEQAKASMEQMTQKAKSLGIKAEWFTTQPLPQDDFWVRIIGYGYLPPTPTMRWCTDKLKIVPPRKVLKRMGVDTAPLFLGVRYGESERRDKILSCSIGGECGPDYMYFKMKQAKVLPVLEWSQCAVWDFLTLIAPGYGYDNSGLVEHYGPDGSLRYGCWSCPLIYNDQTGKFLAKNNPILYDLVTWTNAHFRDGSEAWKTQNRELMDGVGGIVDGRLSIHYCKRLFAELAVIGERHKVNLLNDWQLLSILSVWKWREALPKGQASIGGQLALSFVGGE